MQSLQTITGATPDNAGGGGLYLVQLIIQRNSDGNWWNGSAWVAPSQSAVVNASITDFATGAWSYSNGPSGLNGSYIVYQYALDRALNAASQAIVVNGVAGEAPFAAPSGRAF